MQNMASIIQNHNTNLLKVPAAPTAKECRNVAVDKISIAR